MYRVANGGNLQVRFDVKGDGSVDNRIMSESADVHPIEISLWQIVSLVKNESILWMTRNRDSLLKEIFNRRFLLSLTEKLQPVDFHLAYDSLTQHNHG